MTRPAIIDSLQYTKQTPRLWDVQTYVYALERVARAALWLIEMNGREPLTEYRQEQDLRDAVKALPPLPEETQ